MEEASPAMRMGACLVPTGVRGSTGEGNVEDAGGAVPFAYDI